jgi:hypothetical protein
LEAAVAPDTLPVHVTVRDWLPPPHTALQLLHPLYTQPNESGTTVVDTSDAVPAPAALTAEMRKVYFWPLVRPLTVMGLDVPDTTAVSGSDVTWYDTMAEPPVAAGALKNTVAS